MVPLSADSKRNIKTNSTLIHIAPEENRKCWFSAKKEEDTRASGPSLVPATELADQAYEEICQFAA